jgi:hypothetical protein
MGILAQLKPGHSAYPRRRIGDGAIVIQGQGQRESGFGRVITEIIFFRRRYESRSLRLVGPLPAPVQNYTSLTKRR